MIILNISFLLSASRLFVLFLSFLFIFIYRWFNFFVGLAGDSGIKSTSCLTVPSSELLLRVIFAWHVHLDSCSQHTYHTPLIACVEHRKIILI